MAITNNYNTYTCTDMVITFDHVRSGKATFQKLMEEEVQTEIKEYELENTIIGIRFTYKDQMFELIDTNMLFPDYCQGCKRINKSHLNDDPVCIKGSLYICNI